MERDKLRIEKASNLTLETSYSTELSEKRCHRIISRNPPRVSIDHFPGQDRTLDTIDCCCCCCGNDAPPGPSAATRESVERSNCRGVASPTVAVTSVPNIGPSVVVIMMRLKIMKVTGIWTVSAARSAITCVQPGGQGLPLVVFCQHKSATVLLAAPVLGDPRGRSGAALD
ncbi:hypothetical protein RRG08_043670 [Elysia crispata]|uniref:Uncharacterized protein n=1 Tax=Elysia crispata TaxID=231223 RepID=A0AAE0ZUW8_9GAST|nr:hypothetical protein RRG08_043670 [Elysia crispata]